MWKWKAEKDVGGFDIEADFGKEFNRRNNLST